jgi:hypothetical protein
MTVRSRAVKSDDLEMRIRALFWSGANCPRVNQTLPPRRRALGFRPNIGLEYSDLFGLDYSVLKDSPQPHVETAFGFFTTKPPPISLSDWKSITDPAMNGMLDLSTISFAPCSTMT